LRAGQCLRFILHNPQFPYHISNPMRVLAIDPSLRCTGFAILERANGKVRAVEYGIIPNRQELPLSSCLVAIRDRLAVLIHTHEPDAGAIESTIFVQSYKTAITLGAVRGAVIVAMAERGLPIFDYAPRRVKQAIVGKGAAAKQQVGFMIRAMLGLTENPPPDAADAMAIGLTHFQAHDSAGRGTVILSRV
jgi:crossover junction endodeoxyribonuclease RuvC